MSVFSYIEDYEREQIRKTDFLSKKKKKVNYSAEGPACFDLCY